MAHVHAPGLVLHMYPEELLKHGATHGCEPDHAVAAQHYFVCLSVDAKEGLWMPLFPTSGFDRKPVPESAKTGHSRWTRGTSWYDIEQVWRIPHKAAQRGAAAAQDQSHPKTPNRVALTALPKIEVVAAS